MTKPDYNPFRTPSSKPEAKESRDYLNPGRKSVLIALTTFGVLAIVVSVAIVAQTVLASSSLDLGFLGPALNVVFFGVTTVGATLGLVTLFSKRNRPVRFVGANTVALFLNGILVLGAAVVVYVVCFS